MHELTIVQSLIEAVEADAKRVRASCVRRINVRVGFLRQVDESLLQDAFAIARSHTTAATAELTVQRVGMGLHCRACGIRTEVADWSFECPACGSVSIRLRGGDELELISIEVESPDDHSGVEEEPVSAERSGSPREPSCAR